MGELKVGVVLPSLQVQERDGIDLRDAAWHAEAAGIDSVWLGDHLMTGRASLDIVAALATVAAVTDRISIGAGVFVPAIRPLAWAAKQIASLQHLSGGRLILGIGSGGGAEQWAAAEIDYAERGPRTDHALELLPALLAGERVRLGAHDVELSPAVSTPPIWVGNASPIAIRRAARAGDGWFPSLIPPEQVAAGAARLAELADSPRDIAVGTTGAMGDGVLSSDQIAAVIANAYGNEAANIPIGGSPGEAADRLNEYRAAGATHIVMGFADGRWRDQCDLLAQSRQLL